MGIAQSNLRGGSKNKSEKAMLFLMIRSVLTFGPFPSENFVRKLFWAFDAQADTFSFL